ncbi:MAG: hypothetical protein C0179_02845 [Fervidicoccus sp.]|nr:MAG: hypothetical protein C0179_02845 [Fervidicoccus sp.]
MVITIESELEELINKLVEEEYGRLRFYILNKIRSITLNLMRDAIERIRKFYGVDPSFEIVEKSTESTVSINITISIDPETERRIKEILRRKIREDRTVTSLRIRALYKLIRDELESSSREINALLHNLYKSAGEGNDKTRGGGEEVRSEERGLGDESIAESDL